MSRLDALERRLDAIEADQAREIAELRRWATEQLHVLSERIAKREAASGRIEREHEALTQRVQQLEAALAARAGKMSEKTDSTAEQAESSPATPLEPAQERAQPSHAPAERVQEKPEPPVAVSAAAPIDQTAPAAGREDPPPAAPEQAPAPASAAVPSSADPARPTDLDGRLERAEMRLHEIETNRHMIDELKRDLTHQLGAVHHALPEEQGAKQP